jgi:spore germination protein YaaH
MARRAVSIVAALLVCACSVGPFGSAPSYGIIVVTAGSTLLRGGAGDVPPTLNLRLHAQTAFQVSDVSARVDSAALALRADGGDLVGTAEHPLPLGSPHHLDIAIAGRAEHLDFDFSVIPPTAAMVAAHLDSNDQTVVDAVFANAPDQKAVSDALGPTATLTWADPDHLRIEWSTAYRTPRAIDLPATIPTAEGSHLVSAIHLELGGLSRGSLWRATVPTTPAVKGVPLLAFTSDTAASNTSAAHHLSALNAVAPTGWTAAPDGTLNGQPDPSAVQRAEARGVPIWPLLANDATDPAGTTTLLGNPAAVSQLVGSVAAAVSAGGYAGIHLDFEGVAGSDKPALTALIQAVAAALHKEGAKLAVDIVPHGAFGTNAFSAAYDVKAIGQAADLVDVMTYDEHGDGGKPGPVAGLDWQRAELAATLPDLQPAHTLLGIPLYARRWDGTGGHSDSYAAAVSSALSQPGAHVDYDFAAQTPFIRSGDGTSVTYFDDADSLARKLALVHADGLAGAAAWRLGYEDPALWSLL